MGAYYRVISDTYDEVEADLIIQTDDEDDFEDFTDAVAECVERLQERLYEEDDVLEQIIADTEAAEDWASYCRSITHPEIVHNIKGYNVASLKDRRAVRRIVNAGATVEPRNLALLKKYEALAR